MTGCGSSCGACKFLRRKCTYDCVFAPYFSYDEAATHFAAVHKVFGASNVSRLLSHLPVHNRNDAAITISYEALARVHDPIYGCVAHIFALQYQVASLQEEIDTLSMITNPSVGVADCGSSVVLTSSNNEIEFCLEHDATRIQNDQHQLANLLSPEGCTRVYQGFEGQRQMNIEFANNAFGMEDHLFGDSNLDALEKLIYGVDQEVFLTHPCFKFNNPDAAIPNYECQ